MRRRDFLKTGVQAAAVGAVSVPTGSVLGTDAPTPALKPRVPAILMDYAAEDHRRRLQNIGVCHREIRSCMRKHLVTSYLPAQCCYNLGEYPCRKPWDPGEYDEQELDRLKDHGIQLIQVFDDWNDSLRLFGGDKYTPLNLAGFQRFVAMVQRRGMKLLPYTSTGFLQETDPDFRPEWASEDSRCRVGFWNMKHGSPASPGWRAFVLPKLLGVMDRYGADGIYVDAGYFTNALKAKFGPAAPAADDVPAFEETAEHDGAFLDLLALVYAEIKRRGGILKVHVTSDWQPPPGCQNVYDYIWVGEGGDNADGLRAMVKNHRPYAVPCIDMSFAKIANDDEPYLHAIPYMQFPMLQAGRPFTGERGMIPGVEYVPDDFWMKRCRAAWEFYQANPNGPYSYGMWDAVPPRPETRPTHAKWLKRYLPLAEEGTWAWLEIGDSSLFAGPLPEGVVASAFANRDLYLVLANYGQAAVELETTADYVATDAPSAAPGKRWSLPPRSLQIVRRCV